MATGDQANNLFEGFNLEGSVERLHKSPRTLARLYLITIFQLIEAVSDHVAADALRERIDWKYALHLPLDTPGLEPVLFCEFRKWLLVDQTSLKHLQLLLARMSEVTDFTGKQSLNLEPDQVITEVCQISRLAKTWEALNKVMDTLAARYPESLLKESLPHWYERYSTPQRKINLGTGRLKKHALTHMIGADIFYLLKAIAESGAPGLADLPEVLKLKQIWGEQFEQMEGKVLWRREACASCSLYSILPQSKINSNHDIHI